MDLTTGYKILGLDPQADEREVKQAYKAQVRRWHPDQFPEGSSLKAAAEEQLKQINLAYARVKAHLALHQPAPAEPPPAAAPHPSPDDPSRGETPPHRAPRRSWMDHLFDALNAAFAGQRTGDDRTSADNPAGARQTRSFGQVLDEMTGGVNLSAGKKAAPAGRRVRHSVADRYRQYRPQAGSQGTDDPLDSKGPVSPVSRIRGIGRSR